MPFKSVTPYDFAILKADRDDLRSRLDEQTFRKYCLDKALEALPAVGDLDVAYRIVHRLLTEKTFKQKLALAKRVRGSAKAKNDKFWTAESEKRLKAAGRRGVGALKNMATKK